jgi:signal transduction histidine kinase
MSVRLRLITASLTAMLVLNVLGLSMGFLLYTIVAGPFLGGRLQENVGPIAARYFPVTAVVALGLAALGSLWILAVTIRHVVGPLQKLKRAAGEIRDGNLGYELAVLGRDEFAELGAGFEQMRIRLRDSTRLQQKAETERRAMMASVTHDLQTPITSILGYAEGILDGVADTPEKLQEYASVIRKKAYSLQALAADLSLLSRLENAQLPLDLVPTDLGLFAGELAREFAPGHPELSLQADLPEGLRVSLDPEKMARVLLNLLQNSLKYRRPSGPLPEVRLTLTRNGPDALLTVRDNGRGIPAEDLPHVFDQFYRADASRGQTSGSGLGLSIARQLVQLHGGKIWIQNNPAGGGVAVNLTLPLLEG